MKRALLVMALFAAVALRAESDLSLTVESSAKQIVLGAPMELTVTLAGKDGFTLAKAFGQCDGGRTKLIISGAYGSPVPVATDVPPCPQVLPPPSDGPPQYAKYACKAVEEYRYFLLPGIYTIHAEYVSTGPETQGASTNSLPYWTGRLHSNDTTVEIQSPTGENLKALHAFDLYPEKDEPPSAYAHFFAERGKDLLAKFPASTYAGYILRERVPSLAQWSLACLSNPGETLQTWGNRGGGAENTRGHIAEAQGDMRAYAKNAEAFLKAHPGFVYAAGIRRAYAMCLGLTGHIPDAMAEIQTLTAATGKEAEEAKAFLGEKDGDKAKGGKDG